MCPTEFTGSFSMTGRLLSIFMAAWTRATISLPNLYLFLSMNIWVFSRNFPENRHEHLVLVLVSELTGLQVRGCLQVLGVVAAECVNSLVVKMQDVRHHLDMYQA